MTEENGQSLQRMPRREDRASFLEEENAKLRAMLQVKENDDVEWIKGKEEYIGQLPSGLFLTGAWQAVPGQVGVFIIPGDDIKRLFVLAKRALNPSG